MEGEAGSAGDDVTGTEVTTSVSNGLSKALGSLCPTAFTARTENEYFFDRSKPSIWQFVNNVEHCSSDAMSAEVVTLELVSVT